MSDKLLCIMGLVGAGGLGLSCGLLLDENWLLALSALLSGMLWVSSWMLFYKKLERNGTKS